MEKKQVNVINRNQVNILISIFFAVVLGLIIAEFFEYTSFIYVLKPLLNPLLITIYWRSSENRNNYFILALLFALISNIFFISKEFIFSLLGAIFFMSYIILIIYIVIKIIKIKSYLPVILASIPFLTLFLYVTSLTIDELRGVFYTYILQIIFMSFLGGFSLSNYIIENNKMNYWLLISTVLFTIIQFIFIIKVYYISISIFQPIVALLYSFAQFSLYKFMILSEKKIK
ncbi:MAG: lysoplasmalogenase family protein [Flavobacterium sp.]|uniref:lysoplasmalogenase family protein n=1 Tax=Flavobacterium sp. TaxID=239 RepID=UPI00326711FE